MSSLPIAVNTALISGQILRIFGTSIPQVLGNFSMCLIKRPTRDACLCMGDLPALHFVFLITL